jgi:hypothetical protein
MADYNNNSVPAVATDQGNGVAPAQEEQTISLDAQGTDFLSEEDRKRLRRYEIYEDLFFGRHFEAYNIKIENENFGREYSKLKYIVANFPGLISKIIADLLFIEPPKIKVPDGDQKFVDGLISENKLRIVNYESAISNSYFGDTVFKLRVDKRDSADDKLSIIIEEVCPKIYFPHVNPFNVKEKPDREDLAWMFEKEGKQYVFKEIYQDGKIYHKVYLLEGGKLMNEEGTGILGLDADEVVEEEDTLIGESLLVHVPNWRGGNSYFGVSDYYDLESLFFAMNNRLTKVDAILDKHSDPILMVPPGILDEKGKVKRQHMGVIEKGEGEDNDPAYITWDASLEAAFKEIEKLVELTFMMSETAPDILGMGKGQSDSGRALKFKLLRTIAKAQRKQLYYREALIEVIYKAQKLAKAWDIEIDGKKLQGEPVKIRPALYRLSDGSVDWL